MPNVQQVIMRSRRLVSIAGLAIIAMPVAAGVSLWDRREAAVLGAGAETRRLAIVMSTQISLSLRTVDDQLLRFADSVAARGIATPAALRQALGSREVHADLIGRLAALPQTESLEIIDADSTVVNSSGAWPPRPATPAEVALLDAVRDAPDRVSEMSGAQPDPATGEQTVAISHRLVGVDGRFLGVATARIRLSFFQHAFNSIGADQGLAITLAQTDGTVLVHFPTTMTVPDGRFPAGAKWYRMVASGGGTFESPGVLDGTGSRIISAQPLRDFPLAVSVTRHKHDVLASWRHAAWAIGAGVVVACLAMMLLLRALGVQIRLIGQTQRQSEADATALQQSQARLAEQTVLLQTTLDHMDQGLFMVDGAGRITVWNRRAEDILRVPADLLAGHPTLAAVVERMRENGEFAEGEAGEPDMSLVLSHHGNYERQRPDGSVIEVRSAPLPQGGMVRTITDITARATAERMLSLAAAHDPLTGLANRHGFQNRLDAAIAAAQRAGTALVVLCLDLDLFKAVNDTLGHEAGDRLLAAVAERMGSVLRDSDTLARLGGDEFAAILPGAGAAVAETLAGRLLDAIRAPYPLPEGVARIGVSIGIASYPADGGTAEQLLRNADTAMYCAKEAGRNKWHSFASGDGERERRRVALQQDLRAAIELEQFTLVYQPICDTFSGELVSFESLLRWHSPSRGAVPPSEFIPVAEETGLILPLGRWAIQTACAEAAAWATPVRVAVNLSPAQFRDSSLLEFIRDVLERNRLPGSRLELEVTEGLLLEDTEAVISTMRALRGMGIRMVLDDFGTAHSSLSYLRAFPFDAVKIDRSFMRALSSDRQALALVEAMLAMARALNLEVVGEGVETSEQLALLRHLNCPLAQGYLMGRPAPPDVARERAWQRAPVLHRASAT